MKTDFRTMKSENIEQFLNTVRKYPELYAVNHADYKNGYKKEVAWKKVQKKTGIDVTTMKAKWRNLRDTYKKYKRSQQTNSGQAAKKLSNWHWAEQLSFIDSSINLRKPDSKLGISSIILDTNTISTKIDNSIEAEEVSNDKQNKFHIIQELESVETTAETNPKRETSRRRRRVIKDDPADKIINYLKNRKSGNTVTNASENRVKIACDRMDMEFLGYSNTVKAFPLHKQAIIKLQITKIITQAQLQELNYSPPNPCFSYTSSCNSPQTQQQESNNSQPNSTISNDSSSIPSNYYYSDNDSNMSRSIPSEEQPMYFTEIIEMQSSDIQTHATQI